MKGMSPRANTAVRLDKFGGAIPVGPVLTLAQALDNPFLRANGMVRSLPHPLKPGMRTLANPIKVNGERLAQQGCSQMGADTAALLGETTDGESVVR